MAVVVIRSAHAHCSIRIYCEHTNLNEPLVFYSITEQMYLPNPVLHNIPHPSDWPTSVRHLAPKSYPTDISGLLDFPTFRLTRDIIGELCATRRPDYFLRTPTSFTGGRSIPLRDVFGLVLPAVAFLRHSLEHSDEDGFTNSAGPLLYSLIRALCAIVAGDSLVM